MTAALERYYPPLLKESSGQPPLDAAAPRVAELMAFTPALNRDTRVRVWVAIPISFRSSNFEE